MIKKTVSQLGEFSLIELLSKMATTKRQGRFVDIGIGDDAAVADSPKGKKLLFTTDMLVEGVHFAPKALPQKIGWKALACSISDIAAMGGMPKYAVISLGVRSKTSVGYIQDIYKGLQKCAQRFGVAIVGGDTVKSTQTVINVALVGEANKSEVITRNGASVGDLIFVSGTLGKSLASGHHLEFMPCLMESQYLIKKFKPNAMIDISDGLVQDLTHLLNAKKLGAVLYKEKIPLRKGADLKSAFCDGEDFQLLFTLSPSKALRLKNQKRAKYIFSCIGEITDSVAGIHLKGKDGLMELVKEKGFSHF